MRDNPHIEWSYYALSQNPNITWEIVRDNPHLGWNFGYLSRNLFLFDKRSVRYRKLLSKRKEEVRKTIINFGIIKDIISIVEKYIDI